MRKLVVGLLLMGALAGFGDCDGCDPNKPGQTCKQTSDCGTGLYCSAGLCKGQAQPMLYVTDKVAKKLSFEIDYVQGALPNQQSLDMMMTRLNELNTSGHVRKPDGFEYLVDDTLPANVEPDHGYTFDELSHMVDANKNTRSSGRYAAAYLLYVDGHSANDTGSEKILGYAFGGDRIVIFKKSIDTVCNSAALFRSEVCKLTEASVLTHELGHLMGLVNNGLAMHAPHEDAAHQAHDSNQACLMYWAIEQASGVDLVLNRIIGGDSSLPKLDESCMQDLADAQNLP